MNTCKRRVDSLILCSVEANRDLLSTSTHFTYVREVNSKSISGLVELKSCSVIRSRLFTFLVGKEKEPIVVHAAAIAATSRKPNTLINGGMIESEEGWARIEDVEVNDFIRF